MPRKGSQRKGFKSAGAMEWHQFLMEYRQMHPNLSLKQAMVKASPLYKSQKTYGGCGDCGNYENYQTAGNMRQIYTHNSYNSIPWNTYRGGNMNYYDY